MQSWDHISGGSQCEDQCTSYADSSSYDDSFCCGYQHDSSPHTCHISANGDTSTTSSGSWKKVKGSFTPQSESAGSANCHAICNDFVDKALCESSDYTLCVGGCDVYAAGACVEDVLDYTSCYNEQVKWCNNNCYDTIVEPCITKAAEPCYDSCVASFKMARRQAAFVCTCSSLCNVSSLFIVRRAWLFPGLLPVRLTIWRALASW